MSSALQARRARLAPLLEFLTPGLLHSLGNHLFAVQGNAQVLGMKESEIVRERNAILNAAAQAQSTLDIIRCLSGEAPAQGSEQAGAMLRRICEVSKVSLREAGLRCILAHSSIETPCQVDCSIFTQCFLETLRCLREVLPSGFFGDLHIDLCSQKQDEVVISMQIEQQPALLPFPIDLAAAGQRASDLLEASAARLEGPSESGQLRLHIPAYSA